MIWIPSTTDELAQLYTEEGVIHGLVRFCKANGKYMATTNKHYLGYYSTLQNAQKAVEAKRAVECKTERKIVI